MKRIIIGYSAIFLFLHLLTWWLFFHSPLNIPENIPQTEIKIFGLVFIIYLVTVIIVIEKRIIKNKPETGIKHITLYTTLISFTAEFIFQLIRLPFLNAESFHDRIYFFLFGVIGASLSSLAIAFMTGFQLKTKKTGLLILMIIGFLTIMYLINTYILNV